MEFLPASHVPYTLPRKDPSIAFITCIYPIETDIDCTTPVLERPVHYLEAQSYGKAQVVAGRRTPYPYGLAGSFRENGSRELMELDCIGVAEATEELILMEKELQSKPR